MLALCAGTSCTKRIAIHLDLCFVRSITMMVGSKTASWQSVCECIALLSDNLCVFCVPLCVCVLARRFVALLLLCKEDDDNKKGSRRVFSMRIISHWLVGFSYIFGAATRHGATFDLQHTRIWKPQQKLSDGNHRRQHDKRVAAIYIYIKDAIRCGSRDQMLCGGRRHRHHFAPGTNLFGSLFARDFKGILIRVLLRMKAILR